MRKVRSSRAIHKEMGFDTMQALHLYLKSEGVIERVRNRWQLTREYVGCGLAYTRYVKRIGWRLHWTAEGVAFIKDMCNGQGRLVCKKEVSL